MSSDTTTARFPLAGLVVHGPKRAVAFSDEVLTVFERFELVWPSEPIPEP